MPRSQDLVFTAPRSPWDGAVHGMGRTFAKQDHSTGAEREGLSTARVWVSPASWSWDGCFQNFPPPGSSPMPSHPSPVGQGCPRSPLLTGLPHCLGRLLWVPSTNAGMCRDLSQLAPAQEVAPCWLQGPRCALPHCTLGPGAPLSAAAAAAASLPEPRRPGPRRRQSLTPDSRPWAPGGPLGHQTQAGVPAEETSRP